MQCKRVIEKRRRKNKKEERLVPLASYARIFSDWLVTTIVCLGVACDDDRVFSSL